MAYLVLRAAWNQPHHRRSYMLYFVSIPLAIMGSMKAAFDVHVWVGSCFFIYLIGHAIVRYDKKVRPTGALL